MGRQMFHLPTVLILGAGASMPYGFPSGHELRQRICQGDAYHYLRNYFGSRAEEFVTAFKNSRLFSIDAFLAKRTEFTDVGKAAIAAILCKLENPRIFDGPATPYNTDWDDWYSVLWNKLASKANTIEDFKSNQLKIITFNYDRSLEYFLITSISNTYNVSFYKAQEVLDLIPIVHIYGQLGTLSEVTDRSRRCRAFLDNVNDADLGIASEGIKVIPEARDDEEVFSKLVEWYKAAHNIAFLGFGFDDLNIKRLGITQLQNYYVPETSHLHVLATTLGLTKSEEQMKGEALLGPLKENCWKPLRENCSGLIRNRAQRFR